MSEKTRAEVVIEFSARDVITLEDGYQYFDTPRGGLSAYDLRIIAGELDRRNAAWDAKVQESLNVTRQANPNPVEGGSHVEDPQHVAAITDDGAVTSHR